MTNKTKIEWTQETWNPIAGCSIKSAGCTNCYAMTMAYRLEAMGLDKYQGTTRKSASGRTLWTGKINFDEKALMKPLSWKKPRRIFVNSMSDLFHENVPDKWIDIIFAIMARCPQHTFQILTKRPERMQRYINTTNFDTLLKTSRLHKGQVGSWPLKNVWLLVSVEDQETANERISLLFDTPAAVRGISAEPLLGEIDLFHVKNGVFTFNALSKKEGISYRGKGLDWVIAGGESGPNARPMHPEWVRSLRDQCAAAVVPFFFKQWGEWLPWEEAGQMPFWRNCADHGEIDGHLLPDIDDPDVKDWRHDEEDLEAYPDPVLHQRVGKKAAGHLLDGKVIQQYPGDV